MFAVLIVFVTTEATVLESALKPIVADMEPGKGSPSDGNLEYLDSALTPKCSRVFTDTQKGGKCGF